MSERLAFRCSACGGINRVPADRVTQGPKCGRCKAGLDISAPPFAIDDAGLIKLVRTAPVPVLVDFWAPWCGPCRAVAPHLIQLAKRKAGRLLVAKIDTMKHPNTAAAMRIQSIPTFCVWRGGNVVAQHAGALLGLQLDEFVDPHLT